MKVHPQDALVRLAVALSLKRGHAAQKLVREHTQRPHVDGGIVVPPFHHLGGQVIEGTAERLPPGVGRVDAPAEIGNLQLALDADEEVLGLDVAVNHVLLVAVHQRPGQRRDVGGGAPLAEPLRLLELLVQLSAGGVLEDQVYAVLLSS